MLDKNGGWIFDDDDDDDEYNTQDDKGVSNTLGTSFKWSSEDIPNWH